MGESRNTRDEPAATDPADAAPGVTVASAAAAPAATVGEPAAAVAAAAVAAEWAVGDVILDLYEVAGLLGEGGMGRVYRVRHRGWNLDLAVKSPRRDFFQTQEQKQNFVRECEAWIDLGLHPHTVSCYYVRTLGGIPRVFAECVDGGSLADWIRSGKLYEGGAEAALQRILDVAIQFAWGLGYAHERGLVHQDVKPANVMLTPEGVAKVTDFGLAQARPVGQVELADGKGGTVVVKGRGMTPAYCSPEQASGAELSRRTDIWSWGVSVMEMFTGGVTWLAGQAASQVLGSYLETAQGDARIPRMPQAVVELLRQCFAREPSERPQDMAAVAERLQACYRAAAGEDYGREEPKPAGLLADGLNNRAVSLLDLGKREEAERLFEQALKADPHHVEAMYNRGLVLWRTGRLPDDALVTQLEEVRTSHEGDWRDEYYLGLVHIERGDAEAAVRILEAAARAAPHAAEVQNALAAGRGGLGKWRSRVRVFEGHADDVESVAISPDGRRVFSGSKDKTLRLWELDTGKCVRVFDGHKDSVVKPLDDLTAFSVAISPDGRWGLSGSWDTTLRLWELDTGECLRVLKGHADAVYSVAISPDGRWALSGSGGLSMGKLDTGRAGQGENTLRLWELATGECLRVFQGHKLVVESVAISPDGRWGLSGSWDATLRLWDLATGECVRVFTGHGAYVRSVAISPDGRWGVSASADGTVRVWELASGACVQVLKGHERSGVTSVGISPDGRWVLSGSEDKTLRLWELATGKCARTFEHDSTVKSVAIAPDGRWGLSGGMDRTLRLWELVATGPAAPYAVTRPRSAVEVSGVSLQAAEMIAKARVLLGQGLAREAVGVLVEAQRLSGYERHPDVLELLREAGLSGKRVKPTDVWCVRSFVGHAFDVNSVAISPDGRWGLSGGKGVPGPLRFWELATGNCVRVLEGHGESPEARAQREALSPMLRKQFGAAADTLSDKAGEYFQTVASVAISRDGRWGLSGSPDQTLRLWELATGECICVFRGHTDWVESVAISPDGRWGLSGSKDKTLRLWDLATGKCARVFGEATDSVWVGCVAISPDGRYGLSGGRDKALRLWELATGECVRVFKGHEDAVNAVAISPDGRWALSRSREETFRLWELATGACVRVFEGLTKPVTAVAISPDGRFGLSGGLDATLRLWELGTGKCVRVLEGHTGAVTSVAMSPDARWVLSGSGDQTLRLWEVVWEYEFPDRADWDDDARGYLDAFLTLHCPCADDGISRVGRPSWTDEDFKQLLVGLRLSGYGWLRPDGVRRQLEKMTSEWKALRQPGHSAFSWVSRLFRKRPSSLDQRKSRQRKRDAETWKKKGRLLTASRRHREAIACFDKVLELTPEDAQAWGGKGANLHDLGKPEEAIVCYDRALEIDPRFAPVWSAKGRALVDVKRYEDAVICCDKALKINPKYWDAWRIKGVALGHTIRWYEKDKKREAAECFRKYVRYAPRSLAESVAKVKDLIKTLEQ